jgi:hypothetical protein
MYEVEVLAWIECSSWVWWSFFVGLGNWACGIGCQIIDGCPPDLRKNLPRAVGVLDKLIKDDRKVYLHCTAGVGRSPSVAVAYYYWIEGKNVSFDLAPCMLLANVTLPLISLPWCYNYWLCHWLHVICLWDTWSQFKVQTLRLYNMRAS